MKKVAVMWVCALMVLSPLMILPAGTGADNGASAPRAPTMIYNANDLQNMSMGMSGDFALGNDINASATSGWNGGAGFYPVGTNSNQFNGVLDGRGYNITGLTITRSGQQFVGLFGSTGPSAKIKNVNLLNVKIAGQTYVGGLVGFAQYSSVMNCNISGSVSGTNYLVGGLIGYAYAATVTGCSSTGSVSAIENVGGLVGYLYSGTISGCYSTASASANFLTGGLVGYCAYSAISNSYSTGQVSGRNQYTGGFVGRTVYGSITTSYSTGQVTGYVDAGGLVGLAEATSIGTCYSTGPVNGYLEIGGLVGMVNSLAISNCYSTGSVNGYYYVGGLIGCAYNSAPYCLYSTGFVKGNGPSGGLIGYSAYTQTAYCFWDYQTSGFGGSWGGVGKTTDEMMTQAALPGWDFTGTWGIFEKTTYPYLRWRYPSAVMLSGTAYSDGGNYPLSYGAPITVVDNFGYSVAHFETKTGYTGQYRQIVDRGAMLAALGDPLAKGTSFGKETGSQTYDLDIYNRTILAKGNIGKTISVKDMVTVSAKFRSDVISPLELSDKGLAFQPGYSLVSADGTIFEADRNLTATGGADLRFGGRFSPANDVLLTAGNITFNSGFDTAQNLSLNCTGDIVFLEPVRLGGLSVINARDLIARDILSAASYTQLGGTGVTDFSRGMLDVGNGSASISSLWAAGRIIAGSLSLRTESADLTGFINGASGQAGADQIAILSNIRIGTHFFDGFDLYKFTPEDVFVATEDELYSVDYQPRDPAHETLTWTVETDAGWLEMSSTTGVLSGTPGNDDIGMSKVTVTAHDGPRSLSRTFTLEVRNVNDPPEILTQDVESVMQDVTYSVVYEAVDIDPTQDKLVWSMETDAGWLRLTGNRLWGTPTDADVGEYWVNLTVSDGLGGTDWSNFSLKVENVNDAPRIAVAPVTRALEDAEYRVGFNATDVDEGDTLNWSVETTAGWLRIDARTGVLSGTPSNDDIGSYWVDVMVKDAEGASDSLGFMLTVVNVNDEPVWAQVPADQSLIEGGALLLDVLATDVDLGDVIRYAISTEPASGLSINPVSGAIRWSAAAPGSFVATLTATDGKATVTHAFNITVTGLPPPLPNKPPRIKTITVNPAKVGQAFSYRLNGSDADLWDAVNLTFRLVAGPAGMIVSADGNLLWIPSRDQAGSHTVTVALSDGKDTTTAAFTVEVRKPGAAAASTAGGYTEGWLVAMLFLGLLVGVLVAFVLTRRPPKAAQPAPMAPPPYAMQAPPPVEPARAPPAEPMPSLPPPEPVAAPRTPPPPEPAVETKAPSPDFKP